MKAAPLILALGVGLVGCSSSEPPARAQRVTLTQKGPNLFDLVPATGQPPYCHVFTATATGIVWLQTPTQERMSLDCPAGQLITGATMRVPKRDGKVTVYIIFSDQRLESMPLQLQVQEMVQQYKPVTPFDLRAPGRVIVETLEFNPIEK